MTMWLEGKIWLNYFNIETHAMIRTGMHAVPLDWLNQIP